MGVKRNMGVVLSQEIKKTILKRDKHRCKVCGSDKSLTIHHLFSKTGYPGLSEEEGNLITLCSRCHKEYHQLYHVVTPVTFSQWVLGKTINIKRISVEWMNGETRNLVFYDDPVDERKGLVNDDVKMTMIQVLSRQIEMTEVELVDYMVANFDTNRVQVEKALLELVKSRHLYRYYVDGRTVVRVLETNQ